MDGILRLMPAFLAADLLLPFLLALFYKGYRHRDQVMSALGGGKSPVRVVYSVWLVMLGVFLLACHPGLYARLAGASQGRAWACAALLDIYAVGGCLLSGLFPVGEAKDSAGLSARVHGAASAIGFTALVFEPLAVGLWCFQSGNTGLGVGSLACFALGAGAFVLFILGDKPAFQNTPLACEGLWQRLSLLFMYAPLWGLAWPGILA